MKCGTEGLGFSGGALTAFAFALGLVFACKVEAQVTVYWDTNGNTAGASAGTTAAGTWDQNTAVNWSTSATGGTTGTWQTRTGGGAGNGIAVFSAGSNATGAFNVTVGTVTGVKGITFGEGTVTLTGGSLALAATSTIDTSTNSATIASVISGGFGINKAGSGMLTLSGANSFSGGTQISAGTVQVNNNAALGTGTLTLGGGTTIQAGGGSRTLTNAVVASGNFTFGGSNDLTLSNTFNLGAGNRVITVANSGVTTLSGVVSNSYYANITKAGSGTLVLSGANTFTGPMTVSAGVLRLQNSSALGSSVYGNSIAAGAELQLQGGITVSPGDFAFQGTGVSGSGVVHNISGTNTLGGQLAFATSSTLGLDAGSLTFSGPVTLTAGTLTTTGTGDFAILGAMNGAGGFDFGSSGNTTLSGVINASGGMTLSGAGTVTLSGTSANSGSGAVVVDNGTLVLAKTAGTAALAADVTVNSGTLRLGASNQIVDGKSVTLAGTGAVFDLNGFNETIANLDMTGSSVTTGAGTLGFSSSGGDITTYASASTATISGKLALGPNGSTFAIADGAAGSDLTVSAVVSGSTALVKTGAGLLTLSGTNTFTGPVTLTGGTVSVATIGNGSVAGNLGQATNAAANLLFDGGVLQYTGATSSTNRSFTINTGKIATFDVTANNLTISGSTTATNGGLTKTGAGTLTLSGTNQHTGVTTISGGTLSVATIGNGGVAGNLGKATSAAGNLVFDGGALQYTGATASTNRSFTINTNKTATIDVTTNVLTITGTAAATNGSLIKTGAGTLSLTGTNTFTGGVTVSAGTLRGTGTTDIGGFTAFGNHSGLVSNTNVITVANGATLEVQSSYTADYGNGTTNSFKNLVLNGTGVSGGGALRSTGGNSTWTGNTVLGSNATITNAGAVGDANELFLGAYVANTDSNVALNGNTLTLEGTGNIFITSKVGATAGDSGSVIINGGTNSTVVTYSGYANYYTGSTTVNSGQLLLSIAPSGPANSAILGNLTIGSGSLTTTARVTENYLAQIADTSTVTINSDGTLDLATTGVADTIGSLVLNGGNVTTGTGELNIANGAGNVSVLTSNTSTIAGKFHFLATTGTIDVNAASTLLMSAKLYGTNIVKSGDGKMIVTSDNITNGGYLGTTSITGGTLNIQNSNALGAVSSGTTVSNGATLQLENTSGNVQVGTEALTINGAGYASQGALDSKSGADNRYGGAITLGSSSTIKTDAGNFTISGSITGTAATSTTQTLTVGGAGNTAISGAILNGSAGGTVALTKSDAGTVTLSGANSFTGAIAVNAGTLAVTANNSLGAQTNAVNVASGATFALSGGTVGTPYTNTIRTLTGSGLVSIAGSTTLKVNTPSADTFDGRLTGAGLFEKAGAGTFTFSSTANTSAFNFAGTVQLTATSTTDTLEFAGGSVSSALTIGTLKLTGGTLLLSGAYINVGTLNITGNTILDFGTSGASVLNATNIYIAAGATLTVKNWTSEVDFLFANSDFRQNNASGTLAVQNAVGSTPENQVHFENAAPYTNDGSSTTWVDNATNYYSYKDNEIRPVPEPSTYGLVLLAGCIGLLAWKRQRKQTGLKA